MKPASVKPTHGPFRTIWFDLDATLYSPETGLWEVIGSRIERYLKEVLRFPPETLRAIQKDYYRRYGTTLRGLQLNGQVDPDDYLRFVHNIPLQDYLAPDPELRTLLLDLPQRCWLVTTSDRNHAELVLDVLGIADCFTGCITVESIDYQCKPNAEAYAAALRICGEGRYENVLFLDDSDRNLAGARALGVFTVLVGTTDRNPEAYLSIRRPHDLLEALPFLRKPHGES